MLFNACRLFTWHRISSSLNQPSGRRRTMATVDKTVKTGLGVILLFAGVTTSAWGQVAGGGFSFGGELRGITQLRGKVVCVECSLEEVRAAQPRLTGLYELHNGQEQVVMAVDTINERARWQSIVGSSDRIAVRIPDSLFHRLTAEENLFKEVEIVGLLRNTRTLDISDVAILGPSLAEQAYAAGEQAQAAAVRAEAAAIRAEAAAGRAEMFADHSERTAQQVEAMVEKLEDRSMTTEYHSMASLRRALRLRYARQHGEF
jgi:hypothetical protein